MIRRNKILAVRLECPDREADSTDNRHSMIFITPVERWVFSFGIFWCMMEENGRGDEYEEKKQQILLIASFVLLLTLYLLPEEMWVLNYYYNALHENERFLSMVNLVSIISQENQDDVYLKIIEIIQILSKNEVISN